MYFLLFPTILCVDWTPSGSPAVAHVISWGHWLGCIELGAHVGLQSSRQPHWTGWGSGGGPLPLSVVSLAGSDCTPLHSGSEVTVKTGATSPHTGQAGSGTVFFPPHCTDGGKPRRGQPGLESKGKIDRPLRGRAASGYRLHGNWWQPFCRWFMSVLKAPPVKREGNNLNSASVSK